MLRNRADKQTNRHNLRTFFPAGICDNAPSSRTRVSDVAYTQICRVWRVYIVLDSKNHSSNFYRRVSGDDNAIGRVRLCVRLLSL